MGALLLTMGATAAEAMKNNELGNNAERWGERAVLIVVIWQKKSL